MPETQGNTPNHYDLIIVGAGAGGGTLARTLAPTGRRVLILERGERIPQEAENWEPTEIVSNRRYQTHEQWEDAGAGNEPFRPQAYYRVGGNTKVYGAVLQRLREADFGELRHRDGVSPAWPISYDEFEPYYSRAEDWYTINGRSGDDPTEPRRSRDFPFPPMAHEPRIQQCADRLAAKGFRPFHSELALNHDPARPGRNACIRCATCDPFPCKIHAKSDAETAGVLPALMHDNVTLQTGTRVRRLLPSADGSRVAGLEVEVDGRVSTLTADRYVLSCGAINSAALLLHSACDAWPDGAANGSGLVGRGLMKHNHTALVAISDEPNPTVFQKTLGFNDYYFGSPAHGIDTPLGSVQLTGKAPWQRLQAFSDREMPEAVLRDLAAHCVNWWMTSEDLPDDENRVTATPDGRPRVHFTPNNLAAHRQFLALWQDQLRDIGFYMFWLKTMGRDVVWHQAGTCRFGHNPAASVLDVHCTAHGLPNLSVVDAAFMPAMGATNPTLSIIANAIRVGHHLADGDLPPLSTSQPSNPQPEPTHHEHAQA